MDTLNEGEGGANEADLMKNFTSKFGDLLAGLSEGGEGGDPTKNPLLNAFSGNPGNDKEFEEFSKKINEKMAGAGSGAGGSGEGPVLEKLADEFLHMFMEKDILEEPLKEARESYETYLAKMPDNVPQEDKDRYLNQYDCLKKLLQILDNNPDKKEELIKTFEKMQEYGNPPDDIVNAMGKDPLNAMTFAQIFSNKGTDGDIPFGAGNPPNLGVPNDGDAPCNIF
jgi:hypothetical protein